VSLPWLLLNAALAQPLIHGTDDRTDVSETEWRALADSTSVALIPREAVVERGPRVELRGSPAGTVYALCPDERFSQEPSIARCSGVLIEPELVLTAGHCFGESDACGRFAYVFDYRAARSADPPSVPRAALYGCREIVARVVAGSESERYRDYAVVRLDRPAADRVAAEVSHERWQPGDQVFLIGHPLGLPALIDLGARTTFTDAAGRFSLVTSDTYAGSSGSPAFDEQRRLRGLLVAGHVDFEERAAGCRNSRRIAETGEAGEVVAYVDTALNDLLPRGETNASCTVASSAPSRASVLLWLVCAGFLLRHRHAGGGAVRVAGAPRRAGGIHPAKSAVPPGHVRCTRARDKHDDSPRLAGREDDSNA
jgi:V8-like Glu-specific endopeptidase